MDPHQRRLIKQSYELVERLELARRKIYEHAQVKGGSGATAPTEALARAERMLRAENHARSRHARRMRTARIAAL